MAIKMKQMSASSTRANAGNKMVRAGVKQVSGKVSIKDAGRKIRP